jgi:hypothetical protein
MGRASGRPAIHGPFGHLYLRTIMMVLASVVATSFAIMLLFSLPLCLRLCATPFSVEGVGAGASSPYSSNISPDTDPHSGYCTSTRTFTACTQHRFRRRRMCRSSSWPSPCYSSPTYCPRPRSQPRADRYSSTRYGASRSCSCPFFGCATEEDTVALATLRLSWR